MMPTKIAWTDESWNPVTGCTPVSEGCAHCYAKKMTERFGGDFSTIAFHLDRLEQPDHWRKPRMVFVCSMGDLFHESVPDDFIAIIFGVMRVMNRHTFQVLTKRPERMRAFLNDGLTSNWVRNKASYVSRAVLSEEWVWPLPNVWLGVSVENQKAADERIPLLLDTPAAVRFISAEPLLGPLDLTPWLEQRVVGESEWPGSDATLSYAPRLDWVIVGGESGGPEDRRLVAKNWCGDDCPYTVHDEWRPKPEALKWVRDIRDQCQAAVPFWFKQWGPRAGQGTLLDGSEWRERPEVRA